MAQCVLVGEDQTLLCKDFQEGLMDTVSYPRCTLKFFAKVLSQVQMAFPCRLIDIQVHLNKLECREKVHFFL